MAMTFTSFFIKFLELASLLGTAISKNHCLKSVQIRSFFWSVFSCIRTEYGDLRSKYRPEKIPYLDTFRAVFLM